MELAKIDTQEVQSLGARARTALDEAGALVIDSPEMYELAAEHTKAVKSMAGEIEKRRKEITAPLDKAKKAAMDLFRPFLEQLEVAEKQLKAKMIEFAAEQERRRQEEERRAREQAEAAQRAAEAEAAKQQAALLERSAELVEAGDIAQAEAVAEEAEAMAHAPLAPIVVAAPVTQTAKASGVSIRENWTFEVTDLAALVRAAAERPELVELLTTNDTAIRQLVKALKGKTNIPGIRAFNDPTASVRA